MTRMSLLDRLRQFTKKPPTIPVATRSSSLQTTTAVPETERKGVKDEKKEKRDGIAARPSLRSGVLRRPIITEKATLTETYVFEVDGDATKRDVRAAVNATYGVMPQHVRIMNVRGKQVRWAGRIGQRTSWKKAVVRLPKGKTISVYEGT